MTNLPGFKINKLILFLKVFYASRKQMQVHLKTRSIWVYMIFWVPVYTVTQNIIWVKVQSSKKVSLDLLYVWSTVVVPIHHDGYRDWLSSRQRTFNELYSWKCYRALCYHYQWFTLGIPEIVPNFWLAFQIFLINQLSIEDFTNQLRSLF